MTGTGGPHKRSRQAPTFMRRAAARVTDRHLSSMAHGIEESDMSTARKSARNDDVRAMPATPALLLRVEGEYREMPGLSLTLPQAARLWGLDHSTCELVLTKLIERRVLKRALNGIYVRRQSG